MRLNGNIVRFLCCMLMGLVGLSAGELRAFPLLVQQGDTLARIAQRIYGRVEYERILASANGFDGEGGGPIVAGAQIEVPVLGYRRIRRGDTWPGLATQWLGAPERAAILAFANQSKPWLLPAENAEVLVPYNLRVVAGAGETLRTVSKRFFGTEKRAWGLAQYNGLVDVVLEPGQVLLVPLTDLPLTETGREALRAATDTWGTSGEIRAQQAAAATALPGLLAHVRAGRYVEAVAQGVALLAGSELTVPQQASVQRQLLEAYAALGARGRAAEACRQWRVAAPGARLDPRELSPKLLAACGVSP